MKDYRWFSLLLRAIGVGFTLVFVPKLILSLISLFQYISGSSVAAEQLGWRSVLSLFILVALIVVMLQAAASVYLIFGAPRFVAFCLREVRSRCGGCDFDLRASGDAICPECGLAKPRGGPDAGEPAFRGTSLM